MKHRKLLVIFFILTSFCIHAFGCSETTIPFDIEEDYVGYISNFEPLGSDEIISYTYEKKKLTVYAKDHFGVKRIIGEWNDVYSGSLEFTQNRKKMLFGYYKKGDNYPIFLLDGERGTVEYLFNTPKIMITSQDFSYLIGFDYKHDRKDSDVLDTNLEKIYRFIIVDLKNNCFKNYVYWRIHKEMLGGRVLLLRSMDIHFDFRLIFQVEATLWAEAYYNIPTDHLETIIDDTNLETWRPYSYERTFEERGYYPPEESP